MLQLTTVDLAWAAGFLEGEGHFRNHARAPGVSASQVQREPLERLQRLFGGSIRLRALRYHSFNGSVSKPIHEWALYGPEGRGLMMTLYVFMSPRRKEQIRAALLAWINAGDPAEFGASKANRIKSHCVNGHEFDDPTPAPARSGRKRRCMICWRASWNRNKTKYYARQKVRRTLAVAINDWT